LQIALVRFGDSSTQVIQDQTLRHAAEIPEGVFQTTQERFGGLAADDFAIAFT
jgi:hypothetical protein